MDVSELMRLVGGIAGAVAAVGLILVLPLFLSQRRDLRRLRAWHVLEPERGDVGAPIGPVALVPSSAPAEATDAGPEVATDAGPMLAPIPGFAAAAAAAASRPSPAERVTAERPAHDRVTAERAALEPETGVERVWRRFREPRHPLVIAAGAFLVGAGIFLGAVRFVGSDDDGDRVTRSGVVPAEVEVAVLNGTSSAGLAGKVSDDVQANGYSLGSVGASRDKVDRTLVMFEQGNRREAVSVARALGIKARDVRPLDAAAERSAGGAEVVVIAGEDRARL